MVKTHKDFSAQHFTIMLVTLLIGAFIIRWWHIDTLPAGLYPDEAMNGVDAVHALETHSFQWFYPNNNGREGLFINLQALAIHFFGANIPALKLWSAIFGTLAVLGVSLIAWELWRKRSVALVAAFLLTVSYWGINFSRIGFRAIMMPAILTFSFYFLLRGVRTKRFLDFALSGFIFGLGFHTYIAFRIAPLILIVLAVGLSFSMREFLMRFWKHAAIFTVSATLSLAPMVYTFLTHPEYLESRSASISIFSPDVNHGHFLLTLGKTLTLSLAKYNFYGDQNWRHNYPPYPVLDVITGTLFLTGLLFLTGRTILLARKRFRENDYNKEFAISLFLLSWFFVMLTPEFLTEEGLPHALRSIGTQPVIFLIATIPFLWIGEWTKRVGPGTRVAIFSGTAMLLLIIAGWNLGKYFFFFAGNPNAHSAFNENFTNMAAYANTLPEYRNAYILPNGGGVMIDNELPITAQPILFLTHDTTRHPTFITLDTTITAPAIIIPQEWDDAIATKVQSVFPNTSIETINLHPGTGSEFKVIQIP